MRRRKTTNDSNRVLFPAIKKRKEDTAMRELLMDMICRADEKQLRAIYVFVKKVMRVF